MLPSTFGFRFPLSLLFYFYGYLVFYEYLVTNFNFLMPLMYDSLGLDSCVLRLPITKFHDVFFFLFGYDDDIAIVHGALAL